MDALQQLGLYQDVLKLSDTDVATALGTSNTCVSRWKNGKFKPAAKFRERIALLGDFDPGSVSLGKVLAAGGLALFLWKWLNKRQR